MKAQICIVFSMICALLAGCPAPNGGTYVPPIDDPIGDGQVGEDIPAGMAEVVVEGNLFDAKAMMDWNQIVDHLKPEVVEMGLWFTLESPSKGGGGFPIPQYFSVPVIDGAFADLLLIAIGDYSVQVSARDEFGRELFYCSTSMSVFGNQINRLSILFELTRYFNLKFIVNDLPGRHGDYSEPGQVRVTDGAGNVYFAGYYRQYLEFEGKAAGSVLVFDALLPVDFDGELDGAALLIDDLNGDTFATEIPLNIFDAYRADTVLGLPEISYHFPGWLAPVEVDIDFVVY